MTRKVLLVEIGAGPLPNTTPPTFAPASWFPVVYTPPAPSIPGDFMATPVADAILLTWTDSTAYAPEYLIERADDSNGVPGEWVEVARTTELRYLSVEPTGYAAWFRVRAAALSQFSPYTPQMIAAPISSNPPRIELQIVAGVVTINCIYSQFFLKLTTSVSVQFINVRPSQIILVEVEQAGTGANEIDWGPSVVPVSGVPYIVSPQLGAVDMAGLATNNTGAIWRLTVQQPTPTGGAPSVSLSPSPASASVTTDGVTPNAPSVMVTATASGGTAPVTHAWMRADSNGGTNFLIDNAASATPTFSIAAGTTPYNATQTWRDAVTDSAMLTGQAAVAVTLARVLNQLLSGWSGLTGAQTGNGNSSYIGVASVGIYLRRDGTWEIAGYSVTNGVTTPATLHTGYWHGTPTATIGDGFEVAFAITGTGDGGGPSNGSVNVVGDTGGSYNALSSGKYASVQYTRTASGSGTITRTVAVTVREIGNPGNSVTASCTLQATASR